MADELEACTELAMHGGPRYWHWGRQRMQPVCQPDIYIDGHASGADSGDGFLSDRYWVRTEGCPEALVEPYFVLPQGWLFIVHKTRQADRVAHERTVLAIFSRPTFREESQTTGRYSTGLLGDQLACPAAGGRAIFVNQAFIDRPRTISGLPVRMASVCR